MKNKKIKNLILFILLIIFYNFNFSYSADIDKILQKTRQELNKLKIENNKLSKELSKKLFNKEKDFLKLNNQLIKLNKNYINKTENNDKLLSIYKELNDKYNIENSGVSDLSYIFKNSGEELLTELELSSTSAENHNKINKLNQYLKLDTFEDTGYLNFIFSSIIDEIKASSEIDIFESKCFDSKGLAKPARILRIGNLSLCYQDNNKKIGFLQFLPGNKSLFIVNGFLNNKIKKMLSAVFDNKKNNKTFKLMPLDVTNGLVFKQREINKSLFAKIKQGGFLVYPILLIGLLSVIIVIERIFVLRKQHINSEKLMPVILKYIKENNYKAAIDFCKKNFGAASRVCLAGLKKAGAKKNILEDKLHEAILKELPVLEKFLSALSVFAAVTPLLGLLGTVTGMITTFDTISLFGSGDPKLMSGGISEALITTELGLMVAIPILLLHNFLSGKVNNIVNEMEKNAVTLINFISTATQKQEK